MTTCIFLALVRVLLYSVFRILIFSFSRCNADLKSVSLSLPSLPLLAPGGSIVFQVPGGERGWQDVWTAVRHIGGFTCRVVEDERAVKRCLVLTRLQ